MSDSPLVITEEIVGFMVEAGGVASALEPEEKKFKEQGGVVIRPYSLEGKTYKIKCGDEPALYITINHTEIAGRRYLFEVFLNSKNTEYFQWVVALTRLISGVFRINASREFPEGNKFLFDELKQVFDPKGGYFRPGTYVPSIVAEIGMVMESRARELDDVGLETSQKPPVGPYCKKCFSTEIKLMDGCWVCMGCGDSKCG